MKEAKGEKENASRPENIPLKIACRLGIGTYRISSFKRRPLINATFGKKTVK